MADGLGRVRESNSASRHCLPEPYGLLEYSNQYTICAVEVLVSVKGPTRSNSGNHW